HRALADAVILDVGGVHFQQLGAAVTGHAAVRGVDVENATLGVQQPATVRRSLEDGATRTSLFAQSRLLRHTFTEIAGRGELRAALVELYVARHDGEGERPSVLALVHAHAGALFRVVQLQRARLQRQEFRARVPEEIQGGVVHCDEAAGRTVRDPYRRRVRLEDAAKARFAGRKPLIGNLQGLEPRLHPSQLLLRPLELLLVIFSLCLQRLLCGCGRALLRSVVAWRRRRRRRTGDPILQPLGKQLVDRRRQRLWGRGSRQKTLGAELPGEAFILGIVMAARIEHERNRLQALILLPLATQGEAV